MTGPTPEPGMKEGVGTPNKPQGAVDAAWWR